MTIRRGKEERLAVTRIFTVIILIAGIIAASVATIETLGLKPLTTNTTSNSTTSQSSSSLSLSTTPSTQSSTFSSSSSTTTSSSPPSTRSSSTTIMSSTSSTSTSTSSTTASLALNPTAGLPGSQFIFMFSGGSPKTLYFEQSFSQPNLRFMTNPSGSFTGHVKVPPKTTAGFYNVSILDSSGNVVASATFTVL
jgi:hypothetical protein